MEPVSRRSVLAAAAAGTVATAAVAQTFGNPDQPPQGAINTTGNPSSFTDPGPQNPAIASQFPDAFSPPATNVGDMPMFWASFNNAPRRIQNGGWARQVTQADFAISEEIAGVNMRLTRGGVRELHWHQAAETMSAKAPSVSPPSTPRAAPMSRTWSKAGCGISPQACRIRCRVSARTAASSFSASTTARRGNTTRSRWFAHTPPDILALNFGLPAETFAKIPLHDLYIFQGQMPGPLAQDQAQAAGTVGRMPNSSTFQLAGMAPTRRTAGGEARVADSRNFKASQTIAAALVTVHPGGLREMHWHPNADEWQYYITGQGAMTVFNTGPKVVTQNFKPGDIGYVKRNLGHFVQNTGDTDLVFLEVFRSNRFEDVSLSDWLAHTPYALVAQHLIVDPAVVARFPANKPEIMPE